MGSLNWHFGEIWFSLNNNYNKSEYNYNEMIKKNVNWGMSLEEWVKYLQNYELQLYNNEDDRCRDCGRGMWSGGLDDLQLCRHSYTLHPFQAVVGPYVSYMKQRQVFHCWHILKYSHTDFTLRFFLKVKRNHCENHYDAFFGPHMHAAY